MTDVYQSLEDRILLLCCGRYFNSFTSNYPVGGRGIVFDRFLCIFISLLARLRENGWTDLYETFMEGVTFLANSEKPRDAAMRNTGTGFVVLSHHSLFYLTSVQLSSCSFDEFLTSFRLGIFGHFLAILAEFPVPKNNSNRMHSTTIRTDRRTDEWQCLMAE